MNYFVEKKQFRCTKLDLCYYKWIKNDRRQSSVKQSSGKVSCRCIVQYIRIQCGIRKEKWEIVFSGIKCRTMERLNTYLFYVFA
ncbi:hypothetical protein BLOT_000805 [Blomia tropicalis]|nr:hypothetical protein BLOT_000805 [Blomia tropicalis]